MSDIGSSVPSGDDQEQSRSHEGASSKLDVLVKKLQDTKESTPEPTSASEEKQDRKSRRKPKVTRKVVESEEEDPAIGDIGYEGIEDLLNSMGQEDNSFMSKYQQEASHDLAGIGASTSKEKDSDSVDVDDEGNFILPEGTVVVHPEEVTEDQASHFQGPEFKTTGGRRQVITGDIDNEIIHCTACNKQINTNNSASVKRHPVLKVLICKKCYKWYTSDEIEQDSDGMDEQCRWCGDGGDLLLCDSCNNAFCKSCIRRNLGRKELSDIVNSGDDAKWQCYVCDPKPLASLIHNCTQILKAIEEKEKENASRLEKAKKEKEEKVKLKPEAAATSSSGTRQVAMKSTSKPARMHNKGALQTANVNVARSGKQTVAVAQAKPAPVAVTQGGVTYLVQQPGGTIPLVPQPGVLFQAQGGKLVPVQAAQVGTRIAAQQVRTHGTVQPQNLQQIHTVIAEQWNINEMNVDQVLEKVLAATQSMNMLLYSLREDMKKKTNKAPPNENLRVRKEIAHKFRRAMQAYKKSFLDISQFSLSKSQKVQKKVVPQRQQPQPTIKKRPSQGAKHGGNVEIIELSDSDDGGHDTTSRASASSAKSSLSSKTPVSSSTGQQTSKPQAAATSSTSNSAKKGNLPVAVFQKGSLRKSKTDKDDTRSDASTHNSSPCKSKPVSEEENMDSEVTEIDLDVEQNDTGEKDPHSNSVTDKDKHDSASDNNNVDAIKTSSASGKNDSDSTMREPSPTDDTDIKTKSKDEESSEKDALFDSNDSEPLFDPNLVSKGGKRPASEIEDELSYSKKNSKRSRDIESKPAKRSREDIEAQRRLHKELIEEASTSDEDADTGTKSPQQKSSSSSENSSSDRSDKKKNDEDYEPEKDKKSQPEKSNRAEKQKRKSENKFKDFRVARRKQIEKQKLLQASDSEDALSEEVARKKRSPKKNREKSERTSKAIVADDSDTERKRVSQVNSSSNSENTTDRKQSKSKPKLKECSIRIKRMESGDLCVDNSKSNSTKKIKKSKSEQRDRSDGSNTSMYGLDDEIDRLAKVPVVKHKGKPKEESADKDLKSHKVSLEDRRKMAKDKIQDMDAKGKLTRKTPVKQKGKKNGIEDLSSGEEPSDADEEAEDGAGINGNDSNENAGSEQNNRADNSSDENERAKRALLADDSSDDSDDSDFERTKITRKGAGGARPKKDDDDYAPDEDEEEDASTKKKLLTTKLLQAKISDSDSDLDLKPKKRKKKKDTTDEDVTESEPDFSSSSDDNKKRKKKKGKGKKKRDDSSESDSESSGKKKKGKGKKRKRRAKMATDSSAQSGSGSGSGDGDTPGKKRKKIRKVIKDKKLRKETKDAAKAEEERRERIKERQKQFNQVTVADENSPTKCPQTTKLVLDINDKTKETLIEVYPSLIKKLKPHQVEAVKFLWNCCCESVERMRKEEGAGCILAHCMGLGKTLSTISFVHTLLHNSKRTKMKTALILCPLNTVLNWVNEWTMWFEEDEQFDIYELSNVKDNFTRAAMLKDWQQGGGICIMGYEMYRNLKNHRNVKSKKQKVTFTETLVDPGPDVVVCDEGHILKNADSALSKAINQVKTRRRVVLTGTPLQNNLNEYHCMVDFVKPNLLGTKKEFSNRFTHPISNGQSSDATPRDVKLMQRRAHVLHETLAGCVQRKDYTALTKYLMPKHEYIVSVRLTPVQIKLYEEYLRRNFGGEATVRGGRLFSDYQALMRIWTHPWILKLDEIRQENKRMYDDESSFLDDESMTSEGSFSGNSKSSKEGSDDVVILSEDDDAWKPKGTTKRTRAKAGKKEEEAEPQNEVVSTWKTKSRGGGGASVEEVEPEVDKKVSNEWWSEYVDGDSKRDLTLSGKIMLLAQILKMCDSIGDKVLVFSQSLLSLDLIEDFLEHWDSCQSNETEDEKNKEGALMSWTKGGDYFRMDGSTSASLRQTWCDSFNDPENPRARLFLISTKAGSLGINLVAANRVIVFDASWNPTHDIQSIFRVYRFGQTKPVYVYRFLAQGTMEEKIYERQVTKQSLAQRVVDEHQIDRHFTSQDLSELYVFRPDRLDDPNREERPTPKLPKDRLLAELLTDYPDLMVNYHEHDSLLENRPEQDLSEEERKAAWEEYEAEKKGILRQAPQANYGMPQAAYGNAGLAQMMQMQQQMQQSRYNMGSVTQSQYQTQVYSDAQQIASTIYMQNPGIDQDELQARVAQYVQMRLQNENQLYMRQAQTHQQIQQRDKQIEQEIQKLRDMEIERQRQQQQMMNLLKSGRGPVNLLNTMMADPSTSTRGETSGASSNGNSKSKSNK